MEGAAYECASISKGIHEDVAVHGCGLVVAVDEGDQGMNVAFNKVFQMKAPLRIVDAE